MRSSKPMVAAVVVLALAVVFLLWERGKGQQLRFGDDPEASKAAASSAKEAEPPAAAVGTAVVDPSAPTAQARSAIEFDSIPASAVPASGGPGALERSVIDFQNKAVTAHAFQVIESPKFDDYAAKLQAGADADAVKRMREYRDLFEETLAALPGDKSVNRLACGIKMCMASIVAGKPWPDFDNWQMSLYDLSDLPMQATLIARVDRPGGGVEYRMIFTTSREFNAMQAGPPRP